MTKVNHSITHTILAAPQAAQLDHIGRELVYNIIGHQKSYLQELIMVEHKGLPACEWDDQYDSFF